MKTIISHRILLIVLIAFIFYYGGFTVFVHTYNVDGKIKTHSHPFVPGDEHENVSAIFFTIKKMTDFTYFFLLKLSSITFFIKYVSSIILNVSNEYIGGLCCFYYQRPPPYNSSLNLE